MNTSISTPTIQVIETYIGSKKQYCVDGRHLHEVLGIKTRYSLWISRKINDFGFMELEGYWSFFGESTGGRPPKEYYLSVDMAKMICMLERTENGRAMRKYILANTRSIYCKSILFPTTKYVE